MAGLTSQIKKCIEGKLEQGFDKFIIFPFGDIGMQVKRILNVSYGIQEAYVLDNHLCKYNLKIRELSYLEKIDCRDYCLILSSIDQNIYDSLKADVVKYLKNENIADISCVSSSAGGGGNCNRKIQLWTVMQKPSVYRINRCILQLCSRDRSGSKS